MKVCRTKSFCYGAVGYKEGRAIGVQSGGRTALGYLDVENEIVMQGDVARGVHSSYEIAGRVVSRY
jgi:hypothetical protein